MAELITIKGTAQAEGKQIQGYKFPATIAEFTTPSTVLFAPNYGAILYKKVAGVDRMGKPTTTMQNINKPYSSVNIVSKEGQWLITDEGYYLKWMANGAWSADKIVMLIAQTPATASQPISTTSTPTNQNIINQLNVSDFGKTIRKAQIGFAVVGWSLFALIAYYKWGKSDLWKAGIVMFGLGNLYNTSIIFSKPTIKGSLT